MTAIYLYGFTITTEIFNINLNIYVNITLFTNANIPKCKRAIESQCFRFIRFIDTLLRYIAYIRRNGIFYPSLMKTDDEFKPLSSSISDTSFKNHLS